MRINFWSMLLVLFTSVLVGVAVAAPPSARIHHDIDLLLDPIQGTLEVRDRIEFEASLPGNRKELVFALNAGLTPIIEDPRIDLRRIQAGPAPDRVNLYALNMSAGIDQVTLRYRGRLAQRSAIGEGGQAGAGYGFGAQIGPDGVLLTGASHWYPSFADELVSVSPWTVTRPPASVWMPSIRSLFDEAPR